MATSPERRTVCRRPAVETPGAKFFLGLRRDLDEDGRLDREPGAMRRSLPTCAFVRPDVATILTIPWLTELTLTIDGDDIASS